jgi:uncharacterized protein YgiM (DUF1202 family)
MKNKIQNLLKALNNPETPLEISAVLLACWHIVSAILVLLALAGCSSLVDYNPYAALATPTPSPSPTVAASPTPAESGSSETPSPTPTPTVLCQVTASEALNLRAGPGTSYAVIGWLAAGDILTVTRQEDGWANVITPTGAAGWVNQNFCTTR